MGFQSDRGLHFVAEITQGISRLLQMKWDLTYPVESTVRRSEERMNQRFKRQTGKLHQETQLKWVEVLLLALLRT